MKLIITAALFLVSGAAIAQDVLIMKDGNDLKVKVLELTPKEIKYKRYDNLSGPTIVAPKDGIFMIRYENGTKDVLDHSSTTEDQPVYEDAKFATLKDAIAPHNRVYIQSFDETSAQAFRDVMAEERTWNIVSRKDMADFIIDLRLGNTTGREFTGTAEIIEARSGMSYYKTPSFRSSAVRDIQGKRKLVRQIVDHLKTKG